MKHISIPIFVPHLGCPCQCSFCNQRTITGVPPMTPSAAKAQIDEHLATISPGAQVEIAFFGGSFTAIPRNEMEALLKAAEPYLCSQRVSSIRISTRPDAIDEEVLDCLAHYGVRTIELGIQSISDEVLRACHRGHTAADTYRAARLITARGFALGGQMMIGLPASSADREEETAHAIANLGAQEARIYPVVVFAHTPLAEETKQGLYIPLPIDEAVSRTIAPMEILLEKNVKLLRVGLCETESLHSEGAIVGGAYHPALGELCYNALYYRRIAAILGKMNPSPHTKLKISVAPGRLSMAIGQRRCNLSALQREFQVSLKFAEDPTLPHHAVRVDPLS